jgi:hypothetical protein
MERWLLPTFRNNLLMPSSRTKQSMNSPCPWTCHPPGIEPRFLGCQTRSLFVHRLQTPPPFLAHSLCIVNAKEVDSKPEAPYTHSAKLSDFTVWPHTWRKNWVNCAVLTGNSAGLRTVLSSQWENKFSRREKTAAGHKIISPGEIYDTRMTDWLTDDTLLTIQ